MKAGITSSSWMSANHLWGGHNEVDELFDTKDLLVQRLHRYYVARQRIYY